MASRAAWLASAVYGGWWNRYGPFTGSPYGFSKTPELELQPQDPAHRVVDPGERAPRDEGGHGEAGRARVGAAHHVRAGVGRATQAPDGSQSVVIRPV